MQLNFKFLLEWFSYYEEKREWGQHALTELAYSNTISRFVISKLYFLSGCISDSVLHNNNILTGKENNNHFNIFKRFPKHRGVFSYLNKNSNNFSKVKMQSKIALFVMYWSIDHMIILGHSILFLPPRMFQLIHLLMFIFMKNIYFK